MTLLLQQKTARLSVCHARQQHGIRLAPSCDRDLLADGVVLCFDKLA
jgi:hypothetical protein